MHNNNTATNFAYIYTYEVETKNEMDRIVHVKTQICYYPVALPSH